MTDDAGHAVDYSASMLLRVNMTVIMMVVIACMRMGVCVYIAVFINMCMLMDMIIVGMIVRACLSRVLFYCHLCLPCVNWIHFSRMQNLKKPHRGDTPRAYPAGKTHMISGSGELLLILVNDP